MQFNNRKENRFFFSGNTHLPLYKSSISTKFTPQNYSEKKMQVLWLRYLTEINERTREVPKEFLANPELKKAVKALEESAFTDAQLAGS